MAPNGRYYWPDFPIFLPNYGPKKDQKPGPLPDGPTSGLPGRPSARHLLPTELTASTPLVSGPGQNAVVISRKIHHGWISALGSDLPQLLVFRRILREPVTAREKAGCSTSTSGVRCTFHRSPTCDSSSSRSRSRWPPLYPPRRCRPGRSRPSRSSRRGRRWAAISVLCAVWRSLQTARSHLAAKIG